MNSTELLHEASVDALAKKGNIHTFTICLPLEFASTLKSGDYLQVEEMSIVIKAIDTEYAIFEVALEKLIDSPLAEVTVGSVVRVKR